jgi:O-antigen/teichoic acid export membrane protein
MRTPSNMSIKATTLSTATVPWTRWFAGAWHTTRSEAFARTAFASFAVNAVGAATAVGAQMLLARWLGEHEFGLLAYAASWLALFTLVATAGLDSTSLRFVGAYAGAKDHARLGAYLSFAQRRTIHTSLVLAVIVLLALVASSAWMERGKLVVFLAACVLLPANALAQLYGAFLQGFKRAVWAYAVQGVFRPVLVAGGVALWAVWAGKSVGAFAAVLATIAVTWLVVAMTGGLWRRCLPPPVLEAQTATSDPEWARVSHSMFAMSGSQFLLSQADILIVGLLLGTTAAGVYAVASRLAGLVTFGIISINSVLAPTIADLHARQRPAELQRTVTFASWCVVAYTIPVMAGLALTGKLLLGVFGPGFVEGYVVVLLLALGQFIVAMAGSVGFLLTMTGHQRDAARVVAVTATLAVLLVLLLTPLMGLAGAALGTMIATAARSCILCILVRRRLNISAFAFHTWRPKARHDRRNALSDL